jgi:hypothetical protein
MKGTILISLTVRRLRPRELMAGMDHTPYK